MPIAELAAGFTAAKHLKDLLLGAKNLADATKVNQVIIEAQEHLLTLQQSLFDAQDVVGNIAKEKAELERQITEFENWREKESLYQTIEPKRGIHVYALREECIGGAQPSRMYCPNCFASRIESILQQPNAGNKQTKCFRCCFLVDLGESFVPRAVR